MVQRTEDMDSPMFHRFLEDYQPLIDKISKQKGAKPGQKSLLQLDRFRYGDAIEALGSKKPKRAMNHDDVKTLVEWKLRHGKFRPTLMKLVSANDEAVVSETIQIAMKGYWAKPDASKAMDTITKLKGVGPATASLLLSVHDPERVIFFSDEAFWWLCCEGRKGTIKYTAKEYRQLNEAAAAMTKKLGVSALDVEKVAYVMMATEGPTASTAKKGKKTAKRKMEQEEEKAEESPVVGSVRPSKRGKANK